MAITASVQPELCQIIYMPYPTSRIQFSSILPKKAPVILCNTRLDPMWMAWSGFGRKHLVRKQAGVHDSLGLVLAECKQAATHFPLSDSSAFFHRWPRSYCVKPCRSSLIQANCVRFWPNGSSPEASRCAIIIEPASEPSQNGSSMFTNKVQWNGFNCLRCSGIALS